MEIPVGGRGATALHGEILDPDMGKVLRSRGKGRNPSQAASCGVRHPNCKGASYTVVPNLWLISYEEVPFAKKSTVVWDLSVIEWWKIIRKKNNNNNGKKASITHLGEGFVDLAILVHSSAVLRVSYLVDSCSVDLMEESLGIGGPRTQYGRPRFGVTSNCRRQGLGRVLLSRKRGLTPLPDYPYRVTPRAPVT